MDLTKVKSQDLEQSKTSSISKSNIYICKNVHTDCAVEPLNGPTKVSASFLLLECLPHLRWALGIRLMGHWPKPDAVMRRWVVKVGGALLDIGCSTPILLGR